MPEVAVKTRDQIAADQIQFILRQDWFQPETLKKYIGALKNWQPNQLSVIIDGQIISYNRIVADLQRFLRSLPPDRRQNLSADGLAPDQLDRLESIINEVSGLASPQPAGAEAGPSSANIPPDLKALVAEFDKANQSAVSAQAKSQGWPPERFREELAKQNAITIQMHQVKNYTLSQLQLAVDNSAALENLAASLGVRPEAVKRLAKIHLQTLVDKQITAQTFRQARALITNPVQLAAYYTAQLKQDILSDDLLSLAAADRHPQTKKNNVDAALKNIKAEAAQETAKVKPVIEAAAENLENHPSVQKVARRAAQAAVKQVKPDIPPAKAARLNQQLVRHLNNPSIQEKLVVKALGIPPSQAKVVLNSLRPSLSQLAASTKKLNPLLAADPDGIAADALRRPYLFPKPFVDALKSGKITDAEVAEIFHTARLLDIPVNAVILTRFGVNAQNLAANLQAGKRWLGIIPMGHGLDHKDATIAKLSDLAAAQKQLIDSLKTPPPLLPDQAATRFLKTSRAADRRNGLSEFFDQINLFRLPSALSYNFSRFPPLGSLGNAGSSFVSGLRVQSAPINSFFNFISSAGNTIRQTPSFLTAPFRAVGSAISNRIINPVKTWANTQIKSGLTRAGAWLAKKGITEAAKKVGMALLGKGTAALLAQAVPVAGQIAGVLTLLSALGDIGKFIWANRKEIGFGLASGFLLGQLLLGKLLGFLGTAAWTLGGAALGFAIGGPIGAAIGGTLGYLIGSGALGSVLSGIGTALGSAAAGLSSFIGALTAPSLVAGLGSTIATAGLLGVGAAWAIQTFFIQPNINSALYVQPGPGGVPPIDIVGSCPIPNGYILCGSLGSPYQDGCIGGHGSNEYWDNQGEPACRYGLPVTDPQCTYNDIPGNICNKGNASCQVYGFASDFTYRNGSERCNNQVFLPSINGIKLIWEVSWEGTGDGMLHATDGTNVYEMYLTHLNSAPLGGESGNSTGTLTCTIPTPHVHVEIKINGEYVRPDFLCEEGTISTPAYILRGSLNETNIVVSNTSEIRSGSQTCQWTQNKGLFGGINANYYKADGSPVGWAGYGAGDVKDYGCGASCPTLTFQIDTNGRASIVPYSNSPSPNPNLLMAVSGTDLSSTPGRSPRTALGIAGDEIVLVVMPNASNSELQRLMSSLGVSSALQLDGGGSSTFCSGNQTIWPISGGPRSIPVNIGLESGIFIKQ